MGFFEENPLVFVVAVIATVEVWNLVREPIRRGLLSLRRGRPDDADPTA